MLHYNEILKTHHDKNGIYLDLLMELFFFCTLYFKQGKEAHKDDILNVMEKIDKHIKAW